MLHISPSTRQARKHDIHGNVLLRYTGRFPRFGKTAVLAVWVPQGCDAKSHLLCAAVADARKSFLNPHQKPSHKGKED